MSDALADRVGRVLPHAAAALLLAAFATLATDASKRAGFTFDETAHLAAGISYVQTGDFRMNPEHPALPKLLAGWAASRTGVRCDTTRVSWTRAEQWDFARETIGEGGVPWRRLLDAGRTPMIWIGVLLGATIWFWARAMIGTSGALFALAMYAFCPTALAHAPLVTTDVPLTFTVVATAACLWAAHRGGRLLWTAAAALFFGLSMATKFSAFSYIPVWIALAALPSPARPMRRGFLHAAAFGALGFVFAEAIIAASYGGVFKWTSIADLGLTGRGISPETMGLVRRIPFEVLSRVPWPSAEFARGFKDIVLYTEAGHPTFLLGMRNDSGWWWSPFVTLGVKATLPLLAATIAGSVAVLLKPRLRRADLAFVLVPAALCFATNVAAHLGLGVRHLFPMFPFLMLLAAWPLRGGGFVGGLGALALVAGVAGAQAATTLRARPHYISYFNEAAGGARGGYKILGDSNLDWGQDLPEAAARLKTLGVDRAILCYFGTASPFEFGVEWQMLPPAQREKRFDPWIVVPADAGPLWLAMSATNRQGIYSRGRGRDASGAPYPWLESIAPREVVGGTIFLYEISKEKAALKGLVETYLAHGMRDEAYAALVRWNALDPNDVEAREKLERAREAGMGSEAGQ